MAPVTRSKCCLQANLNRADVWPGSLGKSESRAWKHARFLISSSGSVRVSRMEPNSGLAVSGLTRDRTSFKRETNKTLWDARWAFSLLHAPRSRLQPPDAQGVARLAVTYAHSRRTGFYPLGRVCAPPPPRLRRLSGNTKGYSSTYLAMGFANVRAGTWYPPEHKRIP